MNKRRQRSNDQANRNSAEIAISHKLRQARLAKGYSLADLHKVTKIQERYLRDLEAAKFKNLPGGVYVRAFIKKFADVVGIDGTELLKRFNNQLPDLQNPHYMDNVSRDNLWAQAHQQRIESRHSAVRKSIPLIVLAGVVLIVLIGTWVITTAHRSSLTTGSGPDQSTSISGASSDVNEARLKRIRSRREHRVIVKEPVLSNGRRQINYLISTRKLSRIKLTSLKNSKSTLIKVDHRSPFKVMLKPKRAYLIKLSKPAKLIKFKVRRGSKLRLTVNHYPVKLRYAKQVRLITMKFRK